MIIPEMPESFPREAIENMMRTLGLPADAHLQVTADTVYVTVPRRSTDGKVLRSNRSEASVLTIGVEIR